MDDAVTSGTIRRRKGMVRRQLSNSPLLEAIFEARWELVSDPDSGVSLDPNYKFLLGTFFQAVRERYPFHEALPAASVPEELAAHQVMHRFRASEGGWPRLQIGPGIITVNQTSAYEWGDFRERVEAAMAALHASHPNSEQLTFRMLSLKYINGHPFDVAGNNILEFLRNKMRISVELPQELFERARVERDPRLFRFQTGFESLTPLGVLIFVLGMGQAASREPLLIWEMNFQSQAQHVPEMPSNFGEWLDSSHLSLEEWFFTLIEGDLEREYDRTRPEGNATAV